MRLREKDPCSAFHRFWMSNSDPSTRDVVATRRTKLTLTRPSWNLSYSTAIFCVQFTYLSSLTCWTNTSFFLRQTAAHSILPVTRRHYLHCLHIKFLNTQNFCTNDTENITGSTGTTVPTTLATMQAEASGQAATQSQSAPKSRPRRPRGSRRGGRGGAGNASDSLDFRPASVAPATQTPPSNQTASTLSGTPAPEEEVVVADVAVDAVAKPIDAPPMEGNLVAN
jgi:hypothetical protein